MCGVSVGGAELSARSLGVGLMLGKKCSCNDVNGQPS